MDRGRHGRHDALAVRRVLAGTASWLLFALAWWVVLRRPGAGLPLAVLALPLSAVVVLLVTALWIRHNQRIYARKGPRRGLPAAPPLPDVDRLGRRVLLTADAVRHPEVVVDVVDGRKTYTAVR